MPLGAKPICISCECNVSTLWRRSDSGDPICNACFTKQNDNGNQSNGSQNGNISIVKSTNNGHGPMLRKSSRIKPSKHKFISATKALATKGRSRRIIFKKSCYLLSPKRHKKQPLKAPSAVATVVTGDSVFHDGMYYQIGDIVSLVDHDMSVYYAQIRGFMQDQYNEKSAVISWLLPTQGTSQEDYFDPTTYILGPEEDIPRSMEYMEFVCHAPSEYYKCASGPYPTISHKPDLCYIWTTTENLIKPLLSMDEVFNVKNVKKEKISEPKTTKTKEKKVEKKQEKTVEKMEIVS